MPSTATFRCPLALMLLLISFATAQEGRRELILHEDSFRQLDEIWPTPDRMRTASGAPGPDYWQQQVDHVIDVEIDDERQHLTGSERITYHNNSPDELCYLWVQVDANIFAPDSDGALIGTAPNLESIDFGGVLGQLERRTFDGSAAITRVADADGAPLAHTIVGTLMRVDLPAPLRSGEEIVFSIDWNYAINDSAAVGGRTAFERLEDGNCIYELAQWFPRLCAYYDHQGWQTKQYLGRGEFALEFGSYEVRITVPADHVVNATGALQNPDEVLSAAQRERLELAQSAKEPVFIVTPEEAAAASAERATAKQTWIYRAENVRDFAFATSRRFMWDAMGTQIEGRTVMAMSLFPPEGEPLWHRYSTRAVVQALQVYSAHSTPYPYPKAVSVNGPVGGMEYPMICFNGPRPEKDGTYSERTKFGLISVVIHEVGHNFFPMIINTDERQWTWIDEGFNTFCQYLTECTWQDDYPSRRGEPSQIVEFMKSDGQVPIMTASDAVLQFGNNAYAKTATALNVLRETVLGRELFDFAFREYGRRWAMKRPTPVDFFRTMEDASGRDLDWFWRGWFYSTAACDQAITGARLFRMDSGDPAVDKQAHQAREAAEPSSLSARRNRDLVRLLDSHPGLRDFYDELDEAAPTPAEKKHWEELLARLDEREKGLFDRDLLYYVVDIENIGDLVMPVILEVRHEDGQVEEVRIPPEIWQRSPRTISKLFVTEKPVASFVLDPHGETADVDTTNNRFPRPIEERWFFPTKSAPARNPMQEATESAGEK